MKQPSMESLEDSGWINETEDPLASPSPKKRTVLRPKPSSKDYKSDSSISWIWETVDESDTENDYEDDESITESPLTDVKLRRKSMEWDMSIINSTGSDDEGLYVDPSTKSLNKPSSRVDLTEKMNKSSSSLMTLELLSDREEDEGKDCNMAKSGLSLATAYVDDEPTGVRFNPTPDVQFYITREEYEEEELFKCFYTSMESNLMLESRNKVIDKINSGKMKNPDTMRGLEYWVERTSTQIDRRVDSMIQRVMDEQDDQIEKGIDDQTKLADLSLSVSIESMAVALKIAMRDARVAKKAYRQMFENHEMDLQTMKSSSTETTAAMSSVVLPESLAGKGSKHKRGKENNPDDVSTRSNRSVSSRRSSRSTRTTKSKDKKSKKGAEDNDEDETKELKKMKKRSSDSSKKSSKRKDLKKQSSERSVGSKKSTSSKSKKSKKKSKAKEMIMEQDEEVENGEAELEVPPVLSPTKIKKRKSLDSVKKKRRSSGSDTKVKGKKGGKRASEPEIKVKEKRRSSSSDISSVKDKRRSSAPASLLKQQKRSSSSRHLKEISESGPDPKFPNSSLSSEEDEHLNRTKDQSKNNRRSFMTTKAYQDMGSSWLQFLQDTGEDLTRAALLDDD